MSKLGERKGARGSIVALAVALIASLGVANAARAADDLVISGAYAGLINALSMGRLWGYACGEMVLAFPVEGDTPSNRADACCERNIDANWCRVDGVDNYLCDVAMMQCKYSAADVLKPESTVNRPHFYPAPRFASLRLDWCNVWGGDCGAPAAHQFCEITEGFGWVAQGFQQEEGVQPTKLIGSGEICNEPFCDAFESIQCADTREKHVNPSRNGYRVDWCASWATDCGQPAAHQYCRTEHGSRWYALGYKAAPDVGPTLVLGGNQVCSSSSCDGFAEITCAYDPVMQEVANDLDADGWEDLSDNCPLSPNPLQENSDGDPLGDACDPDPRNEPACSDGVDNDGDGLEDAADPGCTSALDDSERSSGLPCDDGIDNDGDGATDTSDPECSSADDRGEGPPCADGWDDDGDSLVDLDDPDCQDASDATEFHLEPRDILVSDFNRAALYRVDPGTGFTTLLYQGYPLSKPWGVAIEHDGGILVTDYADRLVRIRAEAGSAEIVSQGGLLRSPRGLALHRNAMVLVADDQANGIIAIDPTSGSQALFAPGPYGVSIDLAVDVLFGGPFDLVYATDSASGVDRAVTIDPNSGDVLPSSGGQWGDPLGSPWGMAFDDDGTVLVVDSSLDRVVRLSQYSLRIVESYDDWSLEDPRKIAVQDDGSWILTDSAGIYGTNRGEVYRLDPEDGSQTLLTRAIANPNGVAIVPVTACSDGSDNDGDDAVDLMDRNCRDIFDDSEQSRCGLGYEQALLLPLLMLLRRRLHAGGRGCHVPRNDRSRALDS